MSFPVVVHKLNICTGDLITFLYHSSQHTRAIKNVRNYTFNDDKEEEVVEEWEKLKEIAADCQENVFVENKVVIGRAIYGFIRVYHEMNVFLFLENKNRNETNKCTKQKKMMN